MLALVLLILGFWIFSNIYVMVTMSAEDMHEEFVKGQKFLFGKICANAFYIPAWICRITYELTADAIKSWWRHKVKKTTK